MRLIDADALIEQMEADAEHMEESLFEMAAYAAINDVKHQPTIEPQKWIPITEADPGAAHVLATLRWDEDDYEVTELDYWAIVAAQDDEDYLISDRAKGIIKHVIAWMPLPEAWRGEEK